MPKGINFSRWLLLVVLCASFRFSASAGEVDTSTHFRTFTAGDLQRPIWALKVGVVVPKKPDKYQFSASLVAGGDSTTGFVISFATPVDTGNDIRIEILNEDGHVIFTATSNAKLTVWTFSLASPINNGDSLTLTGYAPKPEKVKGIYGTKDSLLGRVKVEMYCEKIINTGRLPMPNALNAVQAEFAQGGFPQGMTIGVPSLLKTQYAWVTAAKYTDVEASLYTKGDTQSAASHGFDTLISGKRMMGAYKSLPPTKYNSKLFADLIALKVNLAASALGITPRGLGSLIYHDTTANLLNGLTLDSIAAASDAMMEGYYTGTGKTAVHHFGPDSLFSVYDITLSYMDQAFNGAIDTVSFADSLVFTGVRPLDSVAFLSWPGATVPKSKRLIGQTFGRPVTYALNQNYPNPFNPSTVIGYSIPIAGHVSLKVYNALGQEIATLVDAERQAGYQSVQWNAANYASGIYFYRITAGSFTDMKKMAFTK
ncbi:MAG TPA: T9SS type A sorting domain-containing protein [Bacteroidota bacterium]|nr:T9SS type A sorting domain-containing protein [Bacteroidota bacterium]